MKKTPTNNPDDNPKPGLFALILLMIGFGLLAVAALSILNTAFDWRLSLEGADLPRNWEGTIALIIMAVIWTLIAWGINSTPFIRLYRKNKLLTILGCLGILVGTFFALDAYDKSIREANAESLAASQSKNREDTEVEPAPEPERYNPYKDREVDLIVGNPTLDTLKVISNGKFLMEVNPYEFEDENLKPGDYALTLLVGKDTLEKRNLTIPAGSSDDRNLAYVLNPDSSFNIAVLDIQDYYDPESHNKRKGAKTLNYKLWSLNWHEALIKINIEGASFTLPRSPSFSMSYGTALKLVVLPDEYRDNKDKAFDFAIWKFIEEDKKGYIQDDMNFLMLPPKEKRKAIKNRLKNDVKKFEASLEPS